MMYPRINKIFRDLWDNKSRTVLVILAIAVGVMSFGSVFTTQTIMLDDMQTQYRATNPAAIWMSVPGADESTVNWLRRQPEVADAQGKGTVLVKAVIGSKKQNISLISYHNYDNLTVNKPRNIIGQFPPAGGQIVLERQSLTATGARIGDTLTVELPDGRLKKLTIVGTIHDLNSIPPQFSLQLTGYIRFGMMSELGFPQEYNEIDIVPVARFTTLKTTQDLANSLVTRLSERGVKAGVLMVFKPGDHWAKDIMQGFGVILEVIGVFSLILSGFLVVTTISGVITQQRVQIGIMKAIGARVPQIVGIYMIMVLTYGLLALAVAIPAGLLMSYINIWVIFNFLNIDIINFYLPLHILLMEVVASILVPCLSALIPIMGGSKISVREAIYAQGRIKTSVSVGWFSQLTSYIAKLSRPAILAIRNTFRNKSRLALTLGTLTFAGAFFICVINAQSSMLFEIDRLFSKINFDIQLNLSKPYSVSTLKSRVMTLPEISAVEGRRFTDAQVIRKGDIKGSSFTIEGMPPVSDFINPALQSGRWLHADSEREIVIATELLREEPGIKVGQDITLETGGKKNIWHVVGIIFSSFGDKDGYADFDQLNKVLNASPEVSSLFLRVREQTPEYRISSGKILEDNFKRWNITISQTLNRDELRSSIAMRINVIVYTLLFMAILIAIVGGLGLAGTMSLNILERTREIGVLRSIGASNMTVRFLVIAEGLFVGLMSFILSIPLSIPLTYGFNYGLGMAIFQQNLAYTYSINGLMVWLIIVVVISVAASLLSARRAAGLSIRETLAYE